MSCYYGGTLRGMRETGGMDSWTGTGEVIVMVVLVLRCVERTAWGQGGCWHIDWAAVSDRLAD